MGMNAGSLGVDIFSIEHQFGFVGHFHIRACDGICNKIVRVQIIDICIYCLIEFLCFCGQFTGLDGHVSAAVPVLELQVEGAYIIFAVHIIVINLPPQGKIAERFMLRVVLPVHFAVFIGFPVIGFPVVGQNTRRNSHPCYTNSQQYAGPSPDVSSCLHFHVKGSSLSFLLPESFPGSKFHGSLGF